MINIFLPIIIICISYSTGLCMNISDPLLNVIGYDPLVEPQKKEPITATLFLPGLLMPTKPYEYYNNDMYKRLYAVALPNQQSYRLPLGCIRHTSLGQTNEIIPTIYALSKIQEEHTPINLYGNSRGGALAINVIAALLEPTPLVQEKLTQLGITQDTRNTIIHRISQGSIVLDQPLRDVSTLIKGHIRRIFPIMPNFIVALMQWAIKYIALPCISKYRPWSEHVNTSLEILVKKKFRCKSILIVPQSADTLVLHHDMGTYVQSLSTLANNTYLIVPDSKTDHDAPLKDTQADALYHLLTHGPDSMEEFNKHDISIQNNVIQHVQDVFKNDDIQ